MHRFASNLLAVTAGDPLLACRWSGAGDRRTEPHRRPSLWPPLGPGNPLPPSPRGGGRLGREFHALPMEQKVAILDRLTGHLLDVHSVREVGCLQERIVHCTALHCTGISTRELRGRSVPMICICQQSAGPVSESGTVTSSSIVLRVVWHGGSR